VLELGTPGVCNHLTVMAPGHDDKFLVIAYGLMWSEVTASNLLLVDKGGFVLEGDGAPEHTAFFIHSNLHIADPQNNICVLHTHQVGVQGGRVSQSPPTCRRPAFTSVVTTCTH
jgi:ribulose-5-phosphate 4-epimerase/fuculose-1-phosphate aldolase